MIDLEKIINKKPIREFGDSKNYIANINENDCIGCTKCIKSCPFDAIIGSIKLMHSVLLDECTGCGLCIQDCPVDCIFMIEVENEYLPKNPFLSKNDKYFLDKSNKQSCEYHAKLRFEAKQNRLNRKSDKYDDKINNVIDNVKNIIIDVKNRTKSKYNNTRVNILDDEFKTQVILKQKQKSLKYKQRKLNNIKINNK